MASAFRCRGNSRPQSLEAIACQASRGAESQGASAPVKAADMDTQKSTAGTTAEPASESATTPASAAAKAEETLIHVLWINAGLSCDGDSVALTAATQPSIEEIALGALPGLPQVAVHWPLIDFECGPQGGADDFLEWFWKADRGELEPLFLLSKDRYRTRNFTTKGTGVVSGTIAKPANRSPRANGSTSWHRKPLR